MLVVRKNQLDHVDRVGRPVPRRRDLSILHLQRRASVTVLRYPALWMRTSDEIGAADWHEN